MIHGIYEEELITRILECIKNDIDSSLTIGHRLNLDTDTVDEYIAFLHEENCFKPFISTIETSNKYHYLELNLKGKKVLENPSILNPQGLTSTSDKNLISPEKIVFCEGTSQGRKYKDFDALVYKKILGEKHHSTTFVSIGSCSEIEDTENKSIKTISKILKSSEIIKFVDRDDKSDVEVSELKEKGINTSGRRHIECYLLDDEIIKKLCSNKGKEEMIEQCLQAKKEAIQKSIDRGNPPDDVKSASGEIFNELKMILSLTQCGDNKCAFLRDTMAPLITEETSVYQEIEREIFGQ